MNGLDESSVTQDLRGPPDREVGDSVFLRKITLRRKSRARLQLSGTDPCLDMVCYGDVDQLGSLWGKLGYLTTVSHKGNVGRCRATRISRELYIALHGLVESWTDEAPATARTVPGYGQQPLRS